MARPKKAVRSKVYRFSITCVPGQDDDLIAFFESLEQGGMAAGLMTALRQGGMSTQSLDSDVDENELLDSFEDFLF